MKLLIIDDEENIASFLKRGFEEDGYIIDVAYDGEDGEYLASINQYDIILLDWMIPKKSGIELLESLRAKNITTPVLMLTAKDDIKNKIEGLRIGADDYLTKPFSFDELQARIEALYRRVSLSNIHNQIIVKNIIINLDTKILTKDDIKLELSSKEYELLMLLIKHKNSYVSKIQIEENLWNNEEFISSNVVQVTIHNLRKKLRKDIIKNFRGLGYKIEF